MNKNQTIFRYGASALSALGIAVLAGGSVQTATKAPAPKKPSPSAPANKRPAPAAPARNLSIPLPAVALGTPPATLPPDPLFQDASLVVDFSSNWQGYLEPCG